MKSIPSCPGYYADSNGMIHGPRGELTQFSRKGYLKVHAAGKQHRVNRLVCEAFHGPAPTPRHHAAHLNGKRDDNRPDNLAWKTPAENSDDITKHGTLAGEKHPRAQLTSEQVRYIRREKDMGRSVKDINTEFPFMKYSALVHVANGRSYRYVR